VGGFYYHERRERCILAESWTKLWWVSLLFGGLAGTLTPLCAQQPSAPQPWPGSISGVVVNALTGAPVRYANVQLLLLEPKYQASCPTDASGRFVFPDLPPGTYRILAYRNRYVTGAYNVRQPGDPGEALTLAAGQHLDAIRISMTPAAAISGTITEERGEPVPGVWVEVLKSGYERGKPHLQAVSVAHTNDRGEYRVSGLVPGQYYVRVRPMQRPVPIPPGVVRPNRPDVQSTAFYQEILYPGVTSLPQAQRLQLKAGQELANIHMRLNVVETVRLLVRVAGGASDRTTLSIKAADVPINASEFVPHRRVEPGLWEVLLMPGRYQITALSMDPEKPGRGTETVSVSGRLQEVTVTLLDAVPLEGTFRVEGPGADRLRNRTVTLVAGDGLPFFGEPPIASVDNQGRFRFPALLPGLWDINPQPVPHGGYIKSMLLGDYDVLVNDMFITPATREPLHIVIGTQAAKVKGVVLAAKGGPPANAAVLLAPVGKLRSVAYFYSHDATGAEGRFELEGLSPGEYELYAFDRLDWEEYQNPTFLNAFSGRGVKVKLEEGKTVESTLILTVRTLEAAR
jgi:hypothetical protein